MCNFSGMIKNVLPSLRQRAGPQRICSRQKSIRSGTARDSFSQTPHMRGKDVELFALFVHHGITPACAGKRGFRSNLPACPRDHPRMCGEKQMYFATTASCQGSPPHVRGKAGRYWATRRRTGITPACAGKRLSCSCRASQSWDHPRMCGEKKNTFRKLKASTGSPPHVRGKDAVRCVYASLIGITPACAGKSLKENNDAKS